MRQTTRRCPGSLVAVGGGGWGEVRCGPPAGVWGNASLVTMKKRHFQLELELSRLAEFSLDGPTRDGAAWVRGERPSGRVPA